MNSGKINGIKIYCFSSRKELIEFAISEKKSLIAIHADKILHATEQTRSLVNRNIGYPDGVGAVLALKRLGFKNTIRIPGCELWLDIVHHAFSIKSFYLIGATEEVITQTVEKLKSEFKNINVLGYHNGYIDTNEEYQHLLTTIANVKPDIVFVAMGSPKQELLIQEMQLRHSAVYQGLGGSFDVYTGKVKRAPEWWIRNNLEGPYRLIKQPYKIARFIKALPFWWYLLIGKYGKNN